MSARRVPGQCSFPDCEEPLAAGHPDWCDWHADVLRDHRRLTDAPHPGNDFFHARDKDDCPACSQGVDPWKDMCPAPGCEDQALGDAAVNGEFALWCPSHGGLLLDHRLDELEGTDDHYHPQDREHCPACNRWEPK